MFVKLLIAADQKAERLSHDSSSFNKKLKQINNQYAQIQLSSNSVLATKIKPSFSQPLANIPPHQFVHEVNWAQLDRCYDDYEQSVIYYGLIVKVEELQRNLSGIQVGNLQTIVTSALTSMGQHYGNKNYLAMKSEISQINKKCNLAISQSLKSQQSLAQQKNNDLKALNDKIGLSNYWSLYLLGTPFALFLIEGVGIIIGLVALFFIGSSLMGFFEDLGGYPFKHVLIDRHPFVAIFFLALIITTIRDITHSAERKQLKSKKTNLEAEISRIYNQIKSLETDQKKFMSLMDTVQKYLSQSTFKTKYAVHKPYAPSSNPVQSPIKQAPLKGAKLPQQKAQKIYSNYILIANTPNMKSSMKSILQPIMGWIKKSKNSGGQHFSLCNLGLSQAINRAVDPHQLQPQGFKVVPHYDFNIELTSLYQHMVHHQKQSNHMSRILIITNDDPLNCDEASLKKLVSLATQKNVEVFWFTNQTSTTQLSPLASKKKSLASLAPFLNSL